MLNYFIGKALTKNVVSAQILNRTLITKSKYVHSGFSLSRKGGSRLYWRVKDVPQYVEVTFSVTYENGKTRTFGVVEGSREYNKLIGYVGAPKKAVTAEDEDSPKEKPFELQKNQLPADVYKIGEDIPEGKYDFVCVWGHGSINRYVNGDITSGKRNYHEWVGVAEYYNQQCLNVVLNSGEYLHIDGNVVVEIRKSKKIELDL